MGAIHREFFGFLGHFWKEKKINKKKLKHSVFFRKICFFSKNGIIIRTYAEEENCEAIFRRSGSEFIILRMHL
jgi:hypothetical protein